MIRLETVEGEVVDQCVISLSSLLQELQEGKTKEFMATLKKFLEISEISDSVRD
jgi:hypothetical protein